MYDRPHLLALAVLGRSLFLSLLVQFLVVFYVLPAFLVRPVVLFLTPTYFTLVFLGASFGVHLLAGRLDARIHTRVPLPPVVERWPDDVTTVYFPGNGADVTQMARYAGPEGFALADGSRVLHPHSLQLVHRPWLGVKGDGVDVAPYDAWPLSRSEHRAIMPTLDLATRVLMNIRGCVPALRAPRRINLAQTGDVQHAYDIVRDAMTARPNDRVVLFGTSRGAAVALRLTAVLTPEERQRVALVVLEGVFDTVENVLYDRFEKGARFGVRARVVRWLLRRVTQYRPDAPTPLDAARALSAEMRDHENGVKRVPPVAVITSAVDRVVYPTSTRAVYDALVGASRDARVHFLELKASTHSGYTTDSDADRRAYRDFMADMYARYVTV